MLFNSLAFLIFFPTVVVIYFLLPSRFRWVWLLITSYYFYMNWNATYALLILTSTAITFFSGKLIYNSKRDVTKKLWVAVSFISNLGILFFYKYYDFFGYYVSAGLDLLGISMNVPDFDVLLPVGISFYTFQALSYTADSYRKKIEPEKHFGFYALFVSFFPQLVAGPIERTTNLLPQFRVKHQFNYQRVREGLILMLWGYFKKMVVADRLAILVDTVYNNPSEHFGIEVACATVFFAVQIYCDFSGYSDIALGSARIMGFDLMNNFNRPYFSKSVTEFWRRWHISLSTWFRDYLYIPLGGNKKGPVSTYANIFIVFLVSGLWHGASITFVIWGGLHGIYVMAEKALSPLAQKFSSHFKYYPDLFSNKLFHALYTSILVCFAWIFFRANTYSDALLLINNMKLWDWSSLFEGKLYELGLDSRDFWLAIYSMAFLFAVELCQARYPINAIFFRQATIFRWSVYFGLLFIILIFGIYGFDQKSFIYFQF